MICFKKVLYELFSNKQKIAVFLMLLLLLLSFCIIVYADDDLRIDGFTPDYKVAVKDCGSEYSVDVTGNDLEKNSNNQVFINLTKARSTNSFTINGNDLKFTGQINVTYKNVAEKISTGKKYDLKLTISDITLRNAMSKEFNIVENVKKGNVTGVLVLDPKSNGSSSDYNQMHNDSDGILQLSLLAFKGSTALGNIKLIGDGIICTVRASIVGASSSEKYIFSVYDLDVAHNGNYDQYSEGVELISGYDDGTITFSSDTHLGNSSGRVYHENSTKDGSSSDNYNEKHAFAVAVDASDFTFNWTAGAVCGTGFYDDKYEIDYPLNIVQTGKLIVHHYLIDNSGKKTTQKVPSLSGGVCEDEVFDNLEFNEQYSTNLADTADGYEYVEVVGEPQGIVDQEEIVVTYYYRLKDKEKGKVITRHLNETTLEPVANPTETTGNEGDTYTTSPETISGFKLTKQPTNPTGVYTNGTIEVIYYYQPISDEKGVVITKYLNETTLEPVADPMQTVGNIGDTYNTSPKNIPGYTLTRQPTNSAGVYANGTIEVVYYYQPIPDQTGKIIIKYLDETTGNPVADPIEQTGKTGVIYNTTGINVPGYTLTKYPENANGFFTDGTIEVIYYYKKIEYDLVIDDDGHHEWYLRGYEDYTFRMNNNVTREEVATIFYRLTKTSNGDIRQDYNVSVKPYTDVEIDRWSVRPIAYLKELGIMGGYSDGTFKPSKPITRAEFAKVIMAYIKAPNKNVNMFSDLNDDHWASNAILVAANEGWIRGYDDGTFKPDTNISRVETVTIVNRMLKRSLSKEHINDISVPVVDLDPTHWGYADVLEAITSHDYIRANSEESENWNSYRYPFHEDMSDPAYNDV